MSGESPSTDTNTPLSTQPVREPVPAEKPSQHAQQNIEKSRGRRYITFPTELKQRGSESEKEEYLIGVVRSTMTPCGAVKDDESAREGEGQRKQASKRER